MGVGAESYGTLLSSVLIQKLPQELRLAVSREVWTLSALMKVLGEELKARKRTAIPRGEERSLNKSNPSRSTSAALLSGQKGSNPSQCCYCNGEHTADSCQDVMSIEERRRLLRANSRCYVCLKKGHISRNCRMRSKCRVCGGQHHVSICVQPVQGNNYKAVPSLNDAPPTGASSISGKTPHISSTSTTCCYTHADQSVLIQTAKVSVFNPVQPTRREVTLIFDSGSQKSYLTESVRKWLHLEKKGCKTLSIMTFGKDNNQPQSCDVVEIGITTKKDGDKKLTLLTIPLICEPIVQTLNRQQLKTICDCKEEDLADPYTGEPIQPEILIGLDYLWQLVTGETIHLPGGPVAMNTSLGWVLSGPLPILDDIPHSANLITHVLRVGASTRECDKRLDQQLRRFWEIESLGITDNENSLHEQFASIIEFKEGRYCVPGRIP